MSPLPLVEQHFYPGQRIGVAVSGGADSVGLLRALLARAPGLGLVLSIVHVHHGIRGADADREQAFVEALAAVHALPLHFCGVETPAYATQNGETLEEAARHLRYGYFRELLNAGKLDGVATGHNLDDQAETVLHKLLRGAWTEGLGGISPVLILGKGIVLRPLLNVARPEILAYLHSLQQDWREDASNQDLVYTRNRLRHHLLPILKEYNPQLATQLSRLAAIARDEEAWWQKEISRVGKSLLLPGKPVRGGGRASSTHPDEAAAAFELERLRLLDPATLRRVLRWAVAQVQPREAVGLDFEQTGRLMEMCSPAGGVKRLELSPVLWVQRTARELQFLRKAEVERKPASRPADGLVELPVQEVPPLALPIPGSVEHAGTGWTFTSTLVAEAVPPASPAVVRTVAPGDLIMLRYSSGPKKAKEVFERMRIPAEERKTRLVVAWERRILWMEGVELEPALFAGLPFRLGARRRVEAQP